MRIFALTLLSVAVSASAIEIPDSTYSYNVEAQATISTGESTPFWLVNNRQGLSSLKKSNGYLRAGFFRHEHTEGRRFDWQAGADLVVPYGYTSNFVVQQLYGGIRYRSLNLTIGAREWTNSIVDPNLSSGDMVFSQNYRPIPQIMLEMPRYQNIPKTKDWLAVRWYFSVGMYTDSDWERKRSFPDAPWMKNELLHSKGLFLRGGNSERFPLTVEGGLEMACQWGGTLHAVDRYTHEHYTVHLPHSFKDFLKVVVPLAGGNPDDPNQAGERTNVLGNVLGQWSFALNYTPKDNPWKARLYYEHYFDDHSMLFFDHVWKDMLLGVQVEFPENPIVSKFVYEYIITKDQSGAVYWDVTDEIPSQISCRDDYYSNYLYTGWQTWGMGQGNPLLISPIYNTPGQFNSYDFLHNRIKGHHLGWEGDPVEGLHYRTLLTFTRSWGSYFEPTPRILRNVNFLLEVSYSPARWKGWKGSVGIGADGGSLLGRSFGTMFSISKSGWL